MDHSWLRLSVVKRHSSHCLLDEAARVGTEGTGFAVTIYNPQMTSDSLVGHCVPVELGSCDAGIFLQLALAVQHFEVLSSHVEEKELVLCRSYWECKEGCAAGISADFLSSPLRV